MLLYSRSICAHNCSCLFLTLQPGSYCVECFRVLLKSALTNSSSPLAMWVLAHCLPALCPGRAVSFWDSCSAFFSHLEESTVGSFELHGRGLHMCRLYCCIEWGGPTPAVWSRSIGPCSRREDYRVTPAQTPCLYCSYQEKGGVLPQVSSP